MESNNIIRDELTINGADKGVTLIDFWTPWCIPCKNQSDILDDLSGQLNGMINIVKINIDEPGNDFLRDKIDAVPTLCLFKEGKEVKRFIGVQPLETLINTIRKYIKLNNWEQTNGKMR